MKLSGKLFVSKQDFQRLKRMKRTLTHTILESHLAEGDMHADVEIGVRIEHALLQDATGTLAMLEFEALGLDRVRVELAAHYVDHNLLQTDSKIADDHRFLQTAAARYGIHFSRPGNGVSHQVHMERFGVPGKTLSGADSHTPGAAGIPTLGIGAGGLDAALAMAWYPYFLPCPKVLGVGLIGKLPDWVSAKDVILEMLRRRSVGGSLNITVPERNHCPQQTARPSATWARKQAQQAPSFRPMGGRGVSGCTRTGRCMDTSCRRRWN